MEIITSVENKTVKHIAKLKQKKYRDEYGEFFVEGYKNVLDSCKAAPSSVKTVVLAESKIPLADEFTDVKITIVADGVFAKLSETENAQGVLSVHAVPKSAFPVRRCVLLDRVRDPGNLGTIIRTAVACGYDVVSNNGAEIYSPKVTRSGMSAILKCSIGSDIPPEELKAAGYELIVADMCGENVFSAVSPKEKHCIVIGNEADGVSAAIKAVADRTLALPQENMESLNAAVAASVMMYVLKFR